MTTAEELVNAVGSIGLTKGKFTCDYCKKSFQREGTLLAHSCESFTLHRFNNISWPLGGT